MTVVDRDTGCILSWWVEAQRASPTLQAMIDEAPQARYYDSDLFAPYRTLLYSPGIHTPMPNKSETYRVEGTMPSYVTIWPGSPADRVVSRAVSTRCAAPSSCLSSPGTVARFIISTSLTIPFI